MTKTDYKNRLEQLKGQREKIQNDLSITKKQYIESNDDLQVIEKAQEVIQIVSKLTQEQIKIHISDIVNLAIDLIPFSQSYLFDIDFVVRRNKTECDLFFVKDDNRTKPIDSNGGGILDITSFALRLALWSLKLGKKNNTIILDEPFKFLSKNLQNYACSMLKEISDKLDLQLIFVTHEEEFINIADKTFLIKIKGGHSGIETI